ncbi:cation:dicarboxylase symporter family transporter [Bacillus stercoris]|nr:cation:dicarboxylase symporter family transporter [Bacillus stercoris]
MQKKHVSFSKRVFTALGLGIVFGFALQLIYGPTSNIVIQTADWFNIAGGGYVKLLQMVVMPLVFISILGAFTKAETDKKSRENQRFDYRDFSSNNSCCSSCRYRVRTFI